MTEQEPHVVSEPRPYRVMIAASGAAQLAAWIALATRVCLPGGEIHLRGLVTVPDGQSLSEGANSARHLRDTLDTFARALPEVHDDTRVHVDYRPFTRLIEELRTFAIDLLIIQWAGPAQPTGGLTTDAILDQVPCDLVLIADRSWTDNRPTLLALRGGPNLSLGLQTAKALAGDSPVTLFNAVESARDMPALVTLMRDDPRIGRIVTSVGDTVEGIVREAREHEVIVIGARLASPAGPAHASRKPLSAALFDLIPQTLVLVRARVPEALPFHKPRPVRHAEESLSTTVDRWFAENTFNSDEFSDVTDLLRLKEKQGVTISLGLPALNEEATVGVVIRTLKKALMDDLPLLDEIVLIDSDSTDDTVKIAESLGVPVYRHSQIMPEMGTYRGKGEALWKSLHVLRGDIIAWIDTDISNIDPRFVYGLIGPLLKRPSVQYVKGFYQRPIRVGEQMQASGGGRVTELVARPLLNLFYPELSGIIQPLSGEYAGRRTALESVPFFSGYGVETGLLIDLHEHFGMSGIAQVDLQERVHHNQPLVGLSKMSFAIHQVFISRLERRYGFQLLEKANRSMKLIIQEPERFALEIAAISDVERPAMITVPGYRQQVPSP